MLYLRVKTGAMPSPQVDDFISQQEPHIQELLLIIRDLVSNAHPGIQESIKYRIPFYTYKGMLAYLNPFADHVKLGFCKGILLKDPFGILEGSGKEVRLISIRHVNQVNPEIILYLLHQALQINEEKRKI